MIKHIHVSECDSTQDILKEQLGLDATHQGILVSCDRQLKGRGRGNNQWETMDGSLCFSLTVASHPVASFTAIELSVLIAKFFEGSILALKWPNDIWNKHRKKCCGILVQNVQNTMIAGIGLNLYSDHPDFGGIYDSSFSFDKKSWASEIAHFILAHRYPDERGLKKDWEGRCGHMNQLVRISEGTENMEGIFKGLGVHGEAVLAAVGGERRFYNGSLFPIDSQN